MNCRRRSAVDDVRSRRTRAVDEDRRRIRWAVDEDRHRKRWTVDDYRHLRRMAVDDDRCHEPLWVAQVMQSLDRMDDLCVKFMHSVERTMSRSATISASSLLCSSNTHEQPTQLQSDPSVADFDFMEENQFTMSRADPPSEPTHPPSLQIPVQSRDSLPDETTAATTAQAKPAGLQNSQPRRPAATPTSPASAKQASADQTPAHPASDSPTRRVRGFGRLLPDRLSRETIPFDPMPDSSIHLQCAPPEAVEQDGHGDHGHGDCCLETHEVTTSLHLETLVAMAKYGQGDKRWIVTERSDGMNVHNWHWVEHDCLEWYRTFLSSLLSDLTILEGDGGIFIRTNRVTYSTLMGGLLQTGNLDGALNLFDEMRDTKVDPHVVCYNVMIDGFLKNGDFVKGMEMWERLLRDSSVTPNVATYNAMLNGLCKLQKFDEVMDMLDRMVSNGHRLDSFTYAILIHGMCEMGNVDGGLQFYVEMIKNGFHLDVVTSNSLLNGFCKAGRIDESLSMWDSLVRTRNLDFVSYNIFIKALFENGEVNKVISVWEHLKVSNEFQPDQVTYGVVIHGLCQSGYIGKALQALNVAEENGENKLNVYSYSSRINGFCQASKMKHAIQIFREMICTGCSPTMVTYNILIAGFCKVERFQEASSFAKEMVEKGFKPDMVTYSALIDGLCRDKKIDLALEIWNQVFSMGFAADVVLHHVLICGLCNFEPTHGPLITIVTSPIIESLEACCFDKVKLVRDSMMKALQVWKKVSGKGDTAAPEVSMERKVANFGNSENKIFNPGICPLQQQLFQ